MKQKSPRISVNKLAEYMIASPLRRKQIVKDAKYPQKYIETLYSEARSGIKNYIINNYDETILLDLIDYLKSKPCDNDHQATDIKNSISSLRHILSTDLPDLSNCTISEFDGENTMINIEGLNISIYPDLIIKNNINGKIGGIKIHFPKSHELGEGLVYVSTLIKNFFINKGHDNREIDEKLCITIDVFRMKYAIAPHAYIRLMQRLKVSCQEIVLWWNSI